MEALAIFLFAVYLTFLVVLYMGWRMSFVKKRETTIQSPRVTVIVAARNEERNISFLLDDLCRQTYTKFEVIVVNDHSADNTWHEIQKFACNDLRFKAFQNEGAGKKQALTFAVQRATGEIIVTTDADCRVQANWLKELVACLQVPDTIMAVGSVKLQARDFFGVLQAHEFLSLTATSASTLAFGIPSMCNGANLAFWKKAFNAVGGYSGSYNVASGDDQVLMFRMRKKFGNQIRFVAIDQAVVTTAPCVSLKEFIHQRVRWAGKWRHYQSPSVALLALFIFCIHLMVISLPVAVVFGLIDPFVAAGLIGGKLLLEWLLLASVARFTGTPWHYSAFLLLQVIYPIYAVCIGIASTFMSFEWKGRRMKTVAIPSR